MHGHFPFYHYLNEAGDDVITRGARQGRIKQTPKIKRVIPMRVLHPLRLEKHPPNNSPGSQPFQIRTGT